MKNGNLLLAIALITFAFNDRIAQADDQPYSLSSSHKCGINTPSEYNFVSESLVRIDFSELQKNQCINTPLSSKFKKIDLPIQFDNTADKPLLEISPYAKVLITEKVAFTSITVTNQSHQYVCDVYGAVDFILDTGISLTETSELVVFGSVGFFEESNRTSSTCIMPGQSINMVGSTHYGLEGKGVDKILLKDVSATTDAQQSKSARITSFEIKDNFAVISLINNSTLPLNMGEYENQTSLVMFDKEGYFMGYANFLPSEKYEDNAIVAPGDGIELETYMMSIDNTVLSYGLLSVDFLIAETK